MGKAKPLQLLLHIAAAVAGATDERNGRRFVAADFGQHFIGEAGRALRILHIDPMRNRGNAGLAPFLRGADIDERDLALLCLVERLGRGQGGAAARLGAADAEQEGRAEQAGEAAGLSR